MALVNCKKQVKSFATRLTNLRTAIAPKNYEYDVALVGAPRLAIVRTRVLEVQADIDRINRALHLLSEWQAKYAEYIEDVVGEEAAQQAEEEYETFLEENNVENAETGARDEIDRLETLKLPLQAELTLLQEAVAPAAAAAPLAPARPRRKIKLKEYETPNFAGNPKFWQTWWDSFEPIHTDDELTNVEKFHYLMSSLKGPAKKLLIGMQRTNEQYPRAIAMLRSRFGSDALIIDQLHQTLNNMPKSGESVADVRSFADNVQCIISQLTGYHQDINQKQTETMLYNKLPEWANIKLLEAKELVPEADWNVDLLLNKLDKVLKLREQARGYTSGKQKDSSDQSNFRRRQNYTSHAAVNDRKDKKCILCGEGHWASRCTKYSTFADRSKRILEQDKCFKCLGKGHKGTECRSKVVCRRCKKPNHCDIFCLKNFEKGKGYENHRPQKPQNSSKQTKCSENEPSFGFKETKATKEAKQVERVIPFRRMVSGNQALDESSSAF